jgi:hypothetical protein
VPLGALAAEATSATPRSYAGSMNAICLAGSERANAIGQVTSVDDLVTLGPRLVAVDDWELGRFLKLGRPPQSIAKHVARYVSAQRQLNSPRQEGGRGRRTRRRSVRRSSVSALCRVGSDPGERGAKDRRESVPAVGRSALTFPRRDRGPCVGSRSELGVAIAPVRGMAGDV